MSSEDAGGRANPWTSMAEAWTEASKQVTKSVFEANRAAAKAWGFAPETEATRSALETPGTVLGTPEAAMEAPLDALAYREPEWEFDGVGESLEDLAVGDSVTFTKEITDADVRAFARASGDTNRLHLDDEFAEKSRFGGRIVHGTLVAGLISAALARLPLMTIYLSQDLSFEKPVDIGEELTAVCEIVEDLGGHRYRLTTCVYDEDEETVIDGEAVVLIDDLPEGE